MEDVGEVHLLEKGEMETTIVWADLGALSQGYVLVEYPTVANAKAAIEGANGTKLLDQTVGVDFAFVRPPPKDGKQGQGRGGTKGGRGARNRSRSPEGEAVKDD